MLCAVRSQGLVGSDPGDEQAEVQVSGTRHEPREAGGPSGIWRDLSRFFCRSQTHRVRRQICEISQREVTR